MQKSPLPDGDGGRDRRAISELAAERACAPPAPHALLHCPASIHERAARPDRCRRPGHRRQPPNPTPPPPITATPAAAAAEPAGSISDWMKWPAPLGDELTWLTS